MMYYGLLLTAICLSVTGELLLKQGMNQIGGLSLHPDNVIAGLWRTFTTPLILLGFCFVFGGSIFWLSVISRAQLSFAYPMLSLGYILVLFASWIFLKEHFDPMRLVGVVIICMGVIIVSRT